MRSGGQLDQGFTLLEVMLVFVLLGLTATAIVPRLPSNNETPQLNQHTERLAAQLRFAHETALTGGQVIGLRKTGKKQGYSFVRQNNLTNNNPQWVTIDNQRYLKAITLPDDMQLTLQSGNSFWAPALTKQSQSKNRQNQNLSPQLYFWRSGEVSPATVTLCLKEEKQCRVISLKESGEVYVQPS